MAQKFTSLEEAADQLGISKDHLNQLREAGKVRAYRDGASWKFRGEDIEKLSAEGVPELDPGASDLSLDTSDLESSPLAASDPSGLDLAPEDDLKLASEEGELGLDSGGSELELAAEEPPTDQASDVSLEDVDEPTVAGLDEGSDDALAIDDNDSIDINTDSILLSEAELGAAGGRPPSTIIGKAELDLDADLDLSPLDKGAGPASDVRLADESGLLGGDDDLSLDLPSPSGNFEGLDELEVDLEAESSRILAPEDVAKAQAAAKAAAQSKGAGISDLDLAPLDSNVTSTSDIALGSGAGSGVGLSGLSALELDDDDEVLGEGSGSDVTLSGESSGINIISPSDSGLALDEVPLDLSGSAPIGSSLDLGSAAGDDMAIEASGIGMGSALGLESKVGEDFQLTPLGETDDDEEKDSSQVIALDELAEEGAAAPMASTFGEEAAMMGEDFGAVGLAGAAMPMGAVSATEMPFSVWNVMGLAGCILMLGLCGMMTFDLLRNMWSWDGVSTINSSLLEVLNPFIGR
jgi:excisionase family DNA binding protein